MDGEGRDTGDKDSGDRDSIETWMTETRKDDTVTV